jgi:hypothetical protein
MEARGLIINFLLIGLIALSMIVFVVNIQQKNDLNATILNDPSNPVAGTLNTTYSGLESALSSSQGTAQNGSSSFNQETPSTGFGSLIFYTIVNAGTIFTGTLRLIFDTTIGGVATILGVSSIVVVTFTTIIIITIVLLLYSLFRLGR